MTIYAELVEKKGLAPAIDALASIGLVVVPRDPTEEMRQVARQHFGFSPEEKHGPARERLWLNAWHAFLAARPKLGAMQELLAKTGQVSKRMLRAARRAGAPETLDDKALAKIYQAMRRAQGT